MKKIFVVLLAFVSMVSQLMAQKEKFVIKGHFYDNIEGRAVLVNYTPETGQRFDTVRITNGKFTFYGSRKHKGGLLQVLINIKERPYSYLMYAEKGTINLNIHQGFEHYSLSGTPLNEDYSVYIQMLSNMVDSARKASGDNGLTQFSKSLYDAKFGTIARFILEKPASFVGLDLLDQFAFHYQQADKIEKIFSLMSNELKTSKTGTQLANRINGMKTALIGNLAPEFSSKDTSGRTVSLADFRGKYVLVDFWATWCPPCLEEMPFIGRAYEKYKNRNFEILGVSLDNPSTKALWKKMIVTKNMTWPQVSDLQGWETKAVLLYNVQGVPANFLIDTKGTIIATNLRGEALDLKLSEILL